MSFQIPPQSKRRLITVVEHTSGDGVVLPVDQCDTTSGMREFNETANQRRVGKVERLDQDFLARLKLSAVVDEQFGEFLDSWIKHVSSPFEKEWLLAISRVRKNLKN